MARLTCKCGFTMWNGSTPNGIEFTAFSDARLCRLEDALPALPSDPLFLLMDLMDQADYEVWRCPQCRRLYVFDRQDGSDRASYIYRLETDQGEDQICT